MLGADYIFQTIQDDFDAFIEHTTEVQKDLWRQFLQIHSADMAQFISSLDKGCARRILEILPYSIFKNLFSHLSDYTKVLALSLLSESNKKDILQSAPIDELTDLFDLMSDEDLKNYLQMLSLKDQKQILSLLEFNPQSAAGIMDTEVLTLRQDFTVEKSIHILQRLKPRLELHQHIYVTNYENILVGYIGLEDLVLRNPKDRLKTFIKKSEIVIQAYEDQEQVAREMIHYQVSLVPVVGDNNHFLGVISSQTAAEIIEEEASEDVYRLSAMTPIRQPYFETSFLKILFQRSYILIILLLAQSLSTFIMEWYSATLVGFLLPFITMLTSTGGNSSSQTSALVIQGMASEEINPSNLYRFLRREFLMALLIALILGTVAFARVYITHQNLWGSVVISLSLTLIVMSSVVLGSGIPVILKRLGMDPAFAAGPFLATIMDILGILIYCYIGALVLGS